MTWKDILAEEPFEGQHWEGAYGLPPGSTVEDWEVHSGGSTPLLSPMDDDSDDDFDSDDLLSSASLDLGKSDASPGPSAKCLSSRSELNNHRYQHRADVEDLQARQYWRPEWRTDAELTRPFDLGDASTLGTEVTYLLNERDQYVAGADVRNWPYRTFLPSCPCTLGVYEISH